MGPTFPPCSSATSATGRSAKLLPSIITRKKARKETAPKTTPQGEKITVPSLFRVVACSSFAPSTRRPHHSTPPLAPSHPPYLLSFVLSSLATLSFPFLFLLHLPRPQLHLYLAALSIISPSSLGVCLHSLILLLSLLFIFIRSFPRPDSIWIACQPTTPL